jgi:uncharacterized membrane protein YgdD (TMEM256/DUF423 family)
MEKRWLLTGLVLIVTGIILGAFGAHGLKEVLTNPEKLQSFETGVRYQMYHGFGFLAIAALMHLFSIGSKMSFYFLLTGVLFFSLSIYGLTWSAVVGTEAFNKILGPITPIGGLLMILGWTLQIVSVVKTKHPKA